MRHERRKQMKRSERLAREGKIEVYIGSVETAKVIFKKELSGLSRTRSLRYIGTDYEALYDGIEVFADVYEDEQNGELFATIS
jgi:hypothetical protein